MSPKALDLVAHDLRKSYGGRPVVDGVSLHIAPGEVVGLLGPNGAGKTTTFYMIVGLIQPDSGQVRLGDRAITGEPMFRRARLGLGYLPQERSAFMQLSVEDNLWIVMEALGMDAGKAEARIDDLLEELGLEGRRHQLATTLSGGERRRLEIARALAVRPTFILLDEPFAGIDPIAVADLQKVIIHLKTLGLGVLITDHNVRETLRITDRASIIKDGQIFAEGVPEELADNPAVRRTYLGDSFRL